MKPGYLTSEFWLALIPQLLAALVMFGVIAPGDASTLQGAIINGITAIGVIAASATTLWQYIQSRTALKTKAVESKVV